MVRLQEVVGLGVALAASACSAPPRDTPVPVGPRASVATTSRLYFAVAGDTRPANEDDTAAYPTTIIDAIVSDIARLSPRPAFVVSTGDYQFASVGGSESESQFALYMQARAKFPGPWFPAMGNHECAGYTDSNCGAGTRDGITRNYANFLRIMLAPIGETVPYYVVHVTGTGGVWTCKLVFVAANAWSGAQGAWLEATLAEPTTYTFVVRHEANEASAAPGTLPSERIIRRYGVTLELCGHTHTYSHTGNRVVIGNGGAPLTGTKDYGFAVVQQRGDGAIVVDAIDYETGEADAEFHFVVTPSGELTE